MLEINIWYATLNDKGVIGAKLTDVAKARFDNGNIGHINLTLNIYGTKSELNTLKTTFPLEFKRAPVLYKSERKDHKQMFLDDSVYERSGKLDGISITHSFWPSVKPTLKNIIASIFGLGGKITPAYNTHEEDMLLEKCSSEIFEIIHEGPVHREVKKLSIKLQNHLTAKERQQQTKLELIKSLLNFIQANSSQLTAIKDDANYLGLVNTSPNEISSTKISTFVDKIDSLLKDKMVSMADIESQLIDAMFSIKNCLSLNESDLDPEIQNLLASSFSNNYDVDSLTRVWGDNLQKLISLTRKLSPELSAKIQRLVGDWLGTRDAIKALTMVQEQCHEFNKKIIEIEKAIVQTNQDLDALADTIAQLQEIHESHEHTKGRAPDASFAVVTRNENNVHYVDEFLLLSYMSKLRDNDSDHKYDLLSNNCAHSVKRAIIEAIPPHTLVALKEMNDLPTDFFSLSFMEIPGAVEKWLHQLNQYIHRLNDRALTETDTFISDIFNDDGSNNSFEDRKDKDGKKEIGLL